MLTLCRIRNRNNFFLRENVFFWLIQMTNCPQQKISFMVTIISSDWKKYNSYSENKLNFFIAIFGWWKHWNNLTAMLGRRNVLLSTVDVMLNMKYWILQFFLILLFSPGHIICCCLQHLAQPWPSCWRPQDVCHLHSDEEALLSHTWYLSWTPLPLHHSLSGSITQNWGLTSCLGDTEASTMTICQV